MKLQDIKWRLWHTRQQRVTGTMSAFDWKQYTQRGTHLQHTNFLRIAKKPVFDVLIVLDCADLQKLGPTRGADC